MTSKREFSFPDFAVLTPDLTPAGRLAVFLGLPQPMQDEAWQELGARVERRSRALFANERLGGFGTAREIAAEIAALWPEAAAVPLGAVQAPAPPEALRARRQIERNAGGDLNALRAIPSAAYVPLLTGRDLERGFVSCPLHDERTPSLHVSQDGPGWYCFGCGAGGDIFDLACALDGRSVPCGAEFVELVRQVAAAIAGGRTWR